jgi:hypothetical protein
MKALSQGGKGEAGAIGQDGCVLWRGLFITLPGWLSIALDLDLLQPVPVFSEHRWADLTGISTLCVR